MIKKKKNMKRKNEELTVRILTLTSGLIIILSIAFAIKIFFKL